MQDGQLVVGPWSTGTDIEYHCARHEVHQ